MASIPPFQLGSPAAALPSIRLQRCHEYPPIGSPPTCEPLDAFHAVLPPSPFIAPSVANSSPRSFISYSPSQSERSTPELLSVPPSRKSKQSRMRIGSAKRQPGRVKSPALPKKASNAFFLYRKQFHLLYPHIDKLEQHQGAKSKIVGAIWRSEPPVVREYFFRLQEIESSAHRIAHGLPVPETQDIMKTLSRRHRVRSRRDAKQDALPPRSELIVQMWLANTPSDLFEAKIQAFDEKVRQEAISGQYLEHKPLVESGVSTPMSSRASSSAPSVTPPLRDVSLPATPPQQISVLDRSEGQEKSQPQMGLMTMSALSEIVNYLNRDPDTGSSVLGASWSLPPFTMNVDVSIPQLDNAFNNSENMNGIHELTLGSEATVDQLLNDYAMPSSITTATTALDEFQISDWIDFSLITT